VVGETRADMRVYHGNVKTALGVGRPPSSAGNESEKLSMSSRTRSSFFLVNANSGMGGLVTCSSFLSVD